MRAAGPAPRWMGSYWGCSPAIFASRPQLAICSLVNVVRPAGVEVREIMRMREWLEETLSKHSKRSPEEVNRDIDRDKILSAQEALEYGLVDQVLTSRKNPQPALGS